MAAEPYDDALVELVAQTCLAHLDQVEGAAELKSDHATLRCIGCDFTQPLPFGEGWDPAMAAFRQHRARAVLDALAGRLLPDGAIATVEYAVRVDVAHPAREWEKAGTLLTHFGPEKSRRAGEVWHGWTPLQRTVVRHDGPWQEVPRG